MDTSWTPPIQKSYVMTLSFPKDSEGHLYVWPAVRVRESGRRERSELTSREESRKGEKGLVGSTDSPLLLQLI